MRFAPGTPASVIAQAEKDMKTGNLGTNLVTPTASIPTQPQVLTTPTASIPTQPQVAAKPKVTGIDALKAQRQNRLQRKAQNLAALGMAKGGKVPSASKRADGCAVRGKTRGKMV